MSRFNSTHTHDDPLAWRYEKYPNVLAIAAKIAECEGRHIQQVAYSSYMGCLTQVCFTERVVRSSWDGSSRQHSAFREEI